MKKHLCSPRFYLLCALVSTLVAGILQTLAYKSTYGTPLANYFDATSLLPKIAVGFSILTCLFGIAAALLYNKEEICENSPLGDLSSLPAAVGMLTGAVLMLLSSGTKLALAIAILFLLATIYQVLLSFRLINDPAVIALIGFANVVGCILLVGYFYFDSSMEMNAPIKISAMIGILFVALYYTYEVRTLLGKPLPKLYTILTVSVTGIGVLASFPVTLAYLVFHHFDKNSIYSVSSLPFQHPEYLACSLILIGVCTSAVWRLCRNICKKTP